MISSFLYEILRFFFLYSVLTLFLYSVYYFIRKKGKYPRFYLGEKYTNYFISFKFVISKKWNKFIVVPFLIYIFLVSFGFMSQENFSRVIKVYDQGQYCNYSKEVVIFPQRMNDDKIVYALEGLNIVQNNSSKNLVLKRNVYHRFRESSSNSYDAKVTILSKTNYYCDELPKYILTPAPRFLRTKKDELPDPVWSLEIENDNPAGVADGKE